MMGQQPAPYPYAVSEEPRELSEQDLAFLSAYTGQKDMQKLQEHVLSVWRSVKAQSWVYCCIQKLMFLEPRITKHEYYPHILATLKSGQPLHFLDLGTCFGQDTRQLLMDGMPADSITVVDITPEYWDFGKQLFMDAQKLEQEPGKGGIEALFGSFTDPAFVSAEPPVGPLGRLAGRVTIAWAGAVLHVLSKEDVRAFAAHAHGILAPGGVWIGTCVGCELREGAEWAKTPDGRAPRFLHSKDSLAALMKDVGFTAVSVKSEPRSNLIMDDEPGPKKAMLMFTGMK